MTTTQNTSKTEDSKYKLILQVLSQFTSCWNFMKMSTALETTWQMALSSLSEEEINMARDRCLRELKYPPVPKDFLKRINPQLKSPEVRPSAIEHDPVAEQTLKELEAYTAKMVKYRDEELPQRPPRTMEGIPMPDHIRARFRKLFNKTRL